MQRINSQTGVRGAVMFDFLLSTKKRYSVLLIVLMYILGIVVNYQFKTVVGGIYIIALIIATVMLGIKVNFLLFPFTMFLSITADLNRNMSVNSFYTKQLVFTITMIFAIYTGFEIKKYLSLMIHRQKELGKLNQDIVLAFVNTMEAKDGYLCGHSLNVSFYAKHICQQLNLSSSDCKNIALAGIFHDMGKIGVSETLLNKPGKLADDEWEEIKKHPVIGADIVAKIDTLQEVSDMIRYHHLHFDGTGYPGGLKGDAIPIGARIISVADSYDAMTSKRPYRLAMSAEEACRELQRCSGTQFDPWVVRAFLSCPIFSQVQCLSGENVLDEAFDHLYRMHA